MGKVTRGKMHFPSGGGWGMVSADGEWQSGKMTPNEAYGVLWTALVAGGFLWLVVRRFLAGRATITEEGERILFTSEPDILGVVLLRVVPILIALTLPLALVAGVALAAKAPAWVFALIFLVPGVLVVFKLLNDAIKGQLTVTPTRVVARAGAQQLLRAVPVAGITQIELASSNLRPGFGSIKTLGWGRLWFGPVRNADKAYHAAVEATLAIQPKGEAGAMTEAAKHGGGGGSSSPWLLEGEHLIFTIITRSRFTPRMGVYVLVPLVLGAAYGLWGGGVAGAVFAALAVGAGSVVRATGQSDYWRPSEVSLTSRRLAVFRRGLFSSRSYTLPLAMVAVVKAGLGVEKRTDEAILELMRAYPPNENVAEIALKEIRGDSAKLRAFETACSAWPAAVTAEFYQQRILEAKKAGLGGAGESLFDA